MLKRSERSSSSSSAETPTPKRNKQKSKEMEGNREIDSPHISMEILLDKLIAIESRMEDNFTNLHSQISELTNEFKHEISVVKSTMIELKKLVNHAWATIEDLQQESKALKDSKSSHQKMMEEQTVEIQLKVGENYYIEDQFEILEEEKKFYESLYRSTNINPQNFKNSPFFNPENATALSEEEKKSCEGVVNEEECMNALKDFNNNKTPGTDGLPAEFYRFFWPDICHDLLASYNFASQHGMLSISQRRGIISLIPTV